LSGGVEPPDPDTAPAPPRARRSGETARAAAVFLAATVLLTWPQAVRMGSGLGDLWDAKLNAWIFHWDYHQTFRDPLHLFHANIFHPARYALAFSENLWGAALFGFPLFASGASTLFVYNFLFLLGMFLSAMAAWALAREVTGDAEASLLGGLVFAFVPWRLAQIPHVQFQWGPFLALLFLFLLRWLNSGRWRDLVLFGVFFAWNALTNVHFTMFSGILLAVVLAWEAVTRDLPARGRRIRLALATAAVAAVVVLPFYVPYARAARLYGMKRSIGEMRSYSARPSALLVAGPQNKLWSPLTQRFARPEAEMFPGVVPVALAVYAVMRLRRRAGREPIPKAELSPGRHRVARVLDGLALLAFAAGVAGLVVPRLRIGPLNLGDPGRTLVFLTAFVLLRLLLAFPVRSRWADLREFLRARRLDRRAGLFVAVGITGLLVALGGYTPYYTFLFQSFGFLFRAIRVPARGMVLLHMALGVLAAWGLSILLRGVRTRAERAAFVGAALLLTAIEYRAAPVDFPAVEKQAAPVYRWLANLRLPGAVLELPIGFDYDAEHVFRSTAHWQALVNGYSGFAPPHYDELRSLFESRPVPQEAWARARELDAALLIFHPHESEGVVRANYSRAVRSATKGDLLEPIAIFRHGESTDYVFRITRAPSFDTGLSDEVRRHARGETDRFFGSEGNLSPPIGMIEFPASVRSGAWTWGWALDDSGILEVRIATEKGDAGNAAVGMPRPDLVKAFPDIPEAEKGGFGFFIPPLEPGPHSLFLTLVAKDGGRTVLRRPIEIR
jgi:hypothetical protein